MPSRILRRSGVAIINMAELLDWRPNLVIQVGIGVHHEEVDVMHEAWPGIRVMGFDPHPGEVSRYRGTFHKIAIGNQDGNAPFYCKANHADGSSVFPIQRSTVITTPVRKLDTVNELYSLVNGSRERVLLWLDCEGSELAVLQGAEKCLKCIDVVNVEMTSKPPSQDWPSPVDVHNYLIDAGFLRQSVHTNRSSSGQCDCIYVRKSLFRPEYACCPCMLGGKGCDL